MEENSNIQECIDLVDSIENWTQILIGKCNHQLTIKQKQEILTDISKLRELLNIQLGNIND